jgi:hypothetical protein
LAVLRGVGKRHLRMRSKLPAAARGAAARSYFR